MNKENLSTIDLHEAVKSRWYNSEFFKDRVTEVSQEIDEEDVNFKSGIKVSELDTVDQLADKLVEQLVKMVSANNVKFNSHIVSESIYSPLYNFSESAPNFIVGFYRGPYGESLETADQIEAWAVVRGSCDNLDELKRQVWKDIDTSSSTQQA